MLFLPDTTLYILTEDGCEILSEHCDSLIRENVNCTVEMSIPTIRTALTGNSQKITAVHEVTKERFEIVAMSTTVKPYKVVVVLYVDAVMPNGQYTYILTDDNGELQRGLLQVGLASASIHQYQPDVKIQSYEG